MAVPPFATRKTTTVLNNTQIKALPTTAVDVVPAPGAGLVLVPVGISYEARFTGGAYTNVDTSPSLITKLDTSSRWETGRGYFFPNASKWTFRDLSSTISRGTMQSQAEKRLALDNASLANKSLKLSMVNASLGNLTGGHASNTLTVIVKYYVVESPAADTIEVTPTTLTLTVADDEDVLTAVVFDQYGDETADAVTWESDDTDVATVVDGTVTRAGNGTCNVIAKVGSLESNACVVTCTA